MNNWIILLFIVLILITGRNCMKGNIETLVNKKKSKKPQKVLSKVKNQESVEAMRPKKHSSQPSVYNLKKYDNSSIPKQHMQLKTNNMFTAH